MSKLAEYLKNRKLELQKAKQPSKLRGVLDKIKGEKNGLQGKDQEKEKKQESVNKEQDKEQEQNKGQEQTKEPDKIFDYKSEIELLREQVNRLSESFSQKKSEQKPQEVVEKSVEKTSEENLSGINFEQAFPKLFKKLRVPDSNQEALINVVRGQGVDIDSVGSEVELEKVFSSAVKQYPVFTRSTQYQGITGNRPQLPEKPDLTNATISERNREFARRMEEMTKK